jgi:hypothetical protein
MKKKGLTGVFTFAIFTFLALAFLPPALMGEDKIVFGVIEPLSGPFAPRAHGRR